MSKLVAMIMLAFALARFVQLPPFAVTWEFLGIFLAFEININTFVAIILAGLTASGTDWLLQDRRGMAGYSAFSHWVLPALTAWVISFPLSILPTDEYWWAAFLIAGAVILIVMLAEYYAADPDDIRHPLASAGLIALSYMLFLIFVISLRSVGVRLIFLLPALALATLLVSLRTINLRLQSTWLFPQSVIILLIVTQFAAAFHYLRVSPISFGVILLGIAYALVNFIITYAQSNIIKTALTESFYIFAIMFAIAIFLP